MAANGTRFTDRDLIALSIGGNDMSGIDLAGHPDQTAYIVSSAAESAQRAAAGVEQLVAAAAPATSLGSSTGSSKWFPERTLGVGDVDFTDPQRDAWANTYYQQTQQLLAPLAQSGVRIFLFNFGILQERVAADPGRYGFTNATNCEAGPANTQVHTPPYRAGKLFGLLLRELGPSHRPGNGADRDLYGEPDRCANHCGASGEHRHQPRQGLLHVRTGPPRRPAQPPGARRRL